MRVGILQQRALAPHRRFVHCSVGEWGCCLELSLIRTMARTERLRRNGDGDWPLGWLPSPEREVPVYDLAGLVGSPPAGEGVILVVGRGGATWGVMVQRVSHPFTPALRECQPLPTVGGEPLSPLCSEAVRWRGAWLPLLRPERLLAPAEEPEPAAGDVPAADLGSPRPATPLAPVPATGEGPRKLLLFSLEAPLAKGGRILVGAALPQVAEILAPRPPAPLPAAATGVCGLLDWQGRPVPWIDVAERLGLELGAAAPVRRLVVLRSPRGPAYAAVGAAEEPRIVRLPLPLEPCEDEGIAEAAGIRAVFRLGRDTLILPDLARLIQGPPEPGAGRRDLARSRDATARPMTTRDDSETPKGEGR